MLDQPIPAPHHRLPLGRYSDAPSRAECTAAAAEIIATNRRIRDALIECWIKILGEDLTLASMARGYDLSDIPAMLTDMMPDLDSSEMAREIVRDAFDRDAV